MCLVCKEYLQKNATNENQIHIHVFLHSITKFSNILNWEFIYFKIIMKLIFDNAYLGSISLL